MKIVEVAHPLIRHKLGLMRQAGISTKDFRELAAEVAALLTYEATRDLETVAEAIHGWAGPLQVQRIKGRKITVVPILRAGLGMLPGVLGMIPSAKVSVVGLQRDERTLQPVAYYEKLSGRMDERIALILDPMLATAGTLIATVGMLKAAGCKRIKGLFLVAAPEGLARIEAAHPDIEIYTAAIDQCLNAQGYILPAWATQATRSSAPGRRRPANETPPPQARAGDRSTRRHRNPGLRAPSIRRRPAASIALI